VAAGERDGIDMRRWLIGILIAAAVIGLIVTAASSPGQRLGFFPGFRGPSADTTLYGNVDIRQVDLAFNAEGRITEMKVEEGDAVEAGQVLAVLDADFYRHAVALAEARRDAQRAALDRLKAGSRPEEIARARADVAALKALRELAFAVHDRRKSLVATGTVAQQAYDDARAALNEADGKLKSAEETLALAVAGPRREDIEQTEAQLRAEEAALALARNRLAHTTLTAPGPGVVLTRVHEPGAVVLPNTTIYTVTLTDKVWVRTYAPEPLLGRIKPGMKVEVVTDGPPARTYRGWVGYISPTAEFTPKSVETPELRTQLVYRLRVHISDPDAALRQGMPVTIRWRDDAQAK
jgi:HlyD family secretion protein